MALFSSKLCLSQKIIAFGKKSYAVISSLEQVTLHKKLVIRDYFNH